MNIEELEKLAGTIGLLIKIQVRETLGLCFFRIVIAEQKDNIIKIWAEMKGFLGFSLVLFRHLFGIVWCSSSFLMGWLGYVKRKAL